MFKGCGKNLKQEAHLLLYQPILRHSFSFTRFFAMRFVAK